MKKSLVFLIALVGVFLLVAATPVFFSVVIAITPILVGGTDSVKALEEVKEKRGRLATQMLELHKAAETEKRSFSADEKQKWDKMGDDIQKLDEEIRRYQTAVDLERGRATDEEKRQRETPDDPNGLTSHYAAAFRSWLKSGFNMLTPEHRELLLAQEQRDLAAGTPNAGGYTIPQSFSQKLEVALKAFGGMMQVANVVPTVTGAILPWPTVNDTANEGEILSENTTAGDSTDPSFGIVNVNAYTYSSKPILVSNILLQDTGFDLETYIAQMVAERIFRITNKHFTIGDNAGKPQGLLTATTKGADAAATSITFTNMIDLFHSIDPAYRAMPKATWMFNDNTLKLLRKLTDQDGQYIWKPQVDQDVPGTIFGKAYTVNQDMPDIATGAKSVAFGDMSKYLIREVSGGQLKRLVERYAEKNQTGFLLFKRYDGRLLDAGTKPIKHLLHA
jgi:HK97 family phage major capsid protein